MGVKFRTLLPLSLPQKSKKETPTPRSMIKLLEGNGGNPRLHPLHDPVVSKEQTRSLSWFSFLSFFFFQTRNEIPYSDSETYQLYVVFNSFFPSFLHHPHTTRSWPMSSLGGTWLNAWLSICLWFFELYFYFGASLGNARWTAEIRFLKRQGKRFGAWNTTYLLLLSLHFSLSLYPR